MARRTQKTLKEWPKSVRKPTIPPSVLPPEVTGIDIARTMASRESKDQAYLGTMMEDFLKSTTGDMIVRIIHGLKSRASRTAESSDTRIGRIMQLEELLDVFEAYVVNLKGIQAQQAEEREAQVWEQVANRTNAMPPSSSGAGEKD